jgi:nucleoside 2-deoxyribosyltransferase
MFSVGDKWEQAAVAAALEGAGYETYLPQRDGIEVGRVMQLINHPIISGKIADEVMAAVRRWVFALDMYQLLERCESLVFNLDGRVPDDGSVVETAAAFVAGKPIVIYKTTPITMLAGADNPMIEGLSSTWSYVDAVDKIPAAVAAAVSARRGVAYSYRGPANVAGLMTEGSKVWDVMQLIRHLPQESDADMVAWLNALGTEMLAKPAAGQPAPA